MKKNIFINFLSLSITFIILFFLLKKVQWSLIKLVLHRLKIEYLILALLFSFLGNPIFNSLQWKMILEAMEYKVALKDILFLRISTAPFKSVLPLKVGDILRVIFLKRFYRVPLLISTLSVFSHLAINVLTCIVVFAVGAAFNAVIPLKCNIFTIHFLGLSVPIRNTLNIFKKMILKNFFIILCISLIRFFFEIFSFSIIGKALGIYIPLNKILLFYPLVSLIANLPLAFEGLGVREGSIILLFSSFALQEELFILGFLTSLICHFLVPFMGIFFVFKLLKDLNLKDEKI